MEVISQVNVSKKNVSKYREIKSYLTMDVFVACTFNLKLTYSFLGEKAQLHTQEV
jgi:hypothetical protein